MKSPHTQRPDDEAREATEEFIREHTGIPGTEPKRAPAPAKSKA
jgi:myo-inositol-1-phosphate synthase